MTAASGPGFPASPRDRLVFALDVDHIDEAERLVKLLSPHVGMFKVGPRLFTSTGSLVVDLIHGFNSSVFMDFKFHDIPDQISGAAKEVARQRARLFTVHALGGRRMISSVTQAMRSTTLVPGSLPPVCLAVTLLTSHDPVELAELGFSGTVQDNAVRLAQLAIDAGAGGVVCSGQELDALKAVLPQDTMFVVPGIREASDPMGDQARVMTAKEAVMAGATYVVVGRPIRDAEDPVAAAERIVSGIAEAHV